MKMFNIIHLTIIRIVSINFDLSSLPLYISLKLYIRQVRKYLSMNSFFCGKGDWGLNNIFPTNDLTLEQNCSPCVKSGYLWNSFVYIGKDAIETDEEKEIV